MLAGVAIFILGGGMSIGIYLSSRNSPAKTGTILCIFLFKSEQVYDKVQYQYTACNVVWLIQDCHKNF